MRKETPEEIVLRYSKRGMNILKEYLDDDYCKIAAQKLLDSPRGNILLTTGFYVAGHAETDGPPGTYVLAKALNLLGFHAIVVTDFYCKDFFETRQIEAVYVGFDADRKEYEALLQKYKPVYLISIERCGKNSEGKYANMRGKNISPQTATIDTLFELAKDENIPTIGVGDGGNEIGMGNVKEIIEEKLSLVPCVVTVDDLIIATVSNWGAYGLAAYLEILSGEHVLCSFESIKEYLEDITQKGSVDGVSGECKMSVDGFSMEVEEDIVTSLFDAIAS